MLLYVYGVVPISLCRTGSGNGVKGQLPSQAMASMLPASFRLDNNTQGVGARSLSQEEGNNYQPRTSEWNDDLTNSCKSILLVQRLYLLENLWYLLKFSWLCLPIESSWCVAVLLGGEERGGVWRSQCDL